ncbi:hypothetical protein [Candidatus Palauibacter sp.]|uniref:hypothetical protein n=1 Tax=Candidatus Palauibacter sp. TaxID=3101350 RepID=UPI003B02631F
MKLKPVYKWRRYRNVPYSSILVGIAVSVAFSGWYWARSTDEMGLLLTVLAMAATGIAALLIGLELAMFLVPGWRSSPGRT